LTNILNVVKSTRKKDCLKGGIIMPTQAEQTTAAKEIVPKAEKSDEKQKSENQEETEKLKNEDNLDGPETPWYIWAMYFTIVLIPLALYIQRKKYEACWQDSKHKIEVLQEELRAEKEKTSQQEVHKEMHEQGLVEENVDTVLSEKTKQPLEITGETQCFEASPADDHAGVWFTASTYGKNKQQLTVGKSGPTKIAATSRTDAGVDATAYVRPKLAQAVTQNFGMDTQPAETVDVAPKARSELTIAGLQSQTTDDPTVGSFDVGVETEPDGRDERIRELEETLAKERSQFDEYRAGARESAVYQELEVGDIETVEEKTRRARQRYDSLARSESGSDDESSMVEQADSNGAYPNSSENDTHPNSLYPL
jgi:hypothetical protein